MKQKCKTAPLHEPGEPYRPSNGTEGELFIERYCERCARFVADERCNLGILENSLVYDIGEPGYPKEWVYGEGGNPTCTAFTTEKPAPKRAPDLPGQMYLFDGVKP